MLHQSARSSVAFLRRFAETQEVEHVRIFQSTARAMSDCAGGSNVRSKFVMAFPLRSCSRDSICTASTTRLHPCSRASCVRVPGGWQDL